MQVTVTKKRLSLILLTFFIVFTAAIPAVYFYSQYQKALTLLADPQVAAKEEAKNLAARAGKLMELPSDEIPTVATVSDREKLKSQPFFSKAKNGDKVLIYQTAKKAVLYDPLNNKILEVAPINIGTSSAAPAAETTLKLALYNGTNTVGLTTALEKTLKTKIGSGFEVVAKDNAGKNDYEKTIVVDLNNNKASQSAQIAKILNGIVSKLPEGEVKPVSTNGTVDILVIIGKDNAGKDTAK